MRKALLAVLAAVVALPLIGYAVYDITRFQPHRDAINAVLGHAAPQDRSPPAEVVRMLDASEKHGPSVYAARLLIRELDVASEQTSMLAWHLNNTLWWSLVKLHLSEQDQRTVILALAPTGEGRKGFTSTALALYDRQPADLSLAEVATVVALIRQPTAQGERLVRIRDILLARYEAHGA
jgi:hypothetical protein